MIKSIASQQRALMRIYTYAYSLYTTDTHTYMHTRMRATHKHARNIQHKVLFMANCYIRVHARFNGVNSNTNSLHAYTHHSY